MTTSIIRAGGTGVPGVQTTGGDDGALALKVGPLAATVEALSITSAGNVGIGTSVPAQKLSVYPDTDVSAVFGKAHVGYVGVADYAGFSHVDADAIGSYALLAGPAGTTFLNCAVSKSINFRVANTDKMIMTSDGNFGIGTAAPVQKLELNENTTSGGPYLQFENRGNNTTDNTNTYNVGGMIAAGYRDSSNPSNIASIMFERAPSSSGAASAGSIVFGAMASGGTGIPTERMRITSAGKVGIGTASPSQKFVVSNAGADNIVMAENSSASIQMFMQATSGTGSVGTLTNHPVQFLENNDEKMRITGGNVGIGTAAPTQRIQGVIGTTGGLPATSGTTQSHSILRLNTTNAGTCLDFGVDGATTAASWIQATAQNNLATNWALALNPNGGNVGIGTASPGALLDIQTAAARSGVNGGVINAVNTNTGGSGAAIAYFQSSSDTGHGVVNIKALGSRSGTNSIAYLQTDQTSTIYHLQIQNGNGLIGSISSNGTTTTYNTSSDYRLKENVIYDWDATTRLKQLKPARFNFITDDATVDGFLAHEAATVVPEAVTGTKDQVEVWTSNSVDNGEAPDGVAAGDNKLDDDENTIPIMQGIDQGKLVPLLVKTILELEARITALEG